MANLSYKIALLGNPNTGKSSVFNQLTGLRQKVGNFPGVTVERKNGGFKLNNSTEVSVTDFPGTYSMFPTSLDERIVLNGLTNKKDIDFPDAVVYVADVNNLERHSLLLTQLIDMEFPIVLALNMNDVAAKTGLTVDIKKLASLFDLPVVSVNGRTGEGLDELKKEIQILLETKKISTKRFYELTSTEKEIAQSIQQKIDVKNEYAALLIAHHVKKIAFLNAAQKDDLLQLNYLHNFNSINNQLDEIMTRYNHFVPIINQTLDKKIAVGNTLTDKIDRFVTHPIFGPVLFFTLMLFVFQAIFTWSSIPMDFIDQQFSNLSFYVQQQFPSNLFTKLVSEGILPGISGVLVFVPQIFILFLLISILEEVGYMSRAVFMFDKIMQRFGLNGRSIVSLISGGACAIPAIMSTRTISNWKERLITIMVTPLISCSARIPVFAVLISFVMPSFKIFGFINSQGLVFMALYLVGVLAALISAFVFKKILKSDEYSFLMLELPAYKMPHWKNVFFNVYDKVKSFVIGAGKIILLVSIILWFLASFGPADKMKEATETAIIESTALNHDAQQTELYVASKKLEYSYAGYAGRIIEPIIKPLGFDWKIGIALITSFAAREVFVGTISTLYSIGKDASKQTIQQKLRSEKTAEGKPVFTVAVALSLILFYLFAMQCVSTLATVYRETKSWKYPAIQLAYMSTLAYVVSLVVYQILK
jgi:ferrous iron transport protein B